MLLPVLKRLNQHNNDVPSDQPAITSYFDGNSKIPIKVKSIRMLNAISGLTGQQSPPSKKKKRTKESGTPSKKTQKKKK